MRWAILEGLTHILSQGGIFLQKLHNTVGQLRMVHAQTFHFVHRKQNPSQENLVLGFERQSKPIYNGSQNLQKLRNTIVPLRLIHELEENIVDGPTNIWA